MEIPLNKAPDILFDQQIWEAFQSYFDTPQIALERISSPPAIPGYYYHRSGDEQLPASIKEQDQIVAEARDLGVALLRGFQDLLFKEHVVARGIPNYGGGGTEREVIPVESWRRLWPNFAHNFAMAFARADDRSCSRYDDMRLTVNDSKVRSAELVSTCASFLRKRKAEGESRRKVLFEETSLHFGSPVPVRIFNLAYKEVFKKARGRPRKK
jgi:hypothetical protein